MALLVYVDDIIIARNDQTTMDTLKFALSKQFKMKDLGPLMYFLDLEVARSIASISSICQRKYALELLSNTGYLAYKPTSILMEYNLKLSQDDDHLVVDPIIIGG